MASGAQLNEGGCIDGLVSACLGELGDLLPGFVPAPSASDRRFWNGLDPDLRARLVFAGHAAGAADWPPLTASAYADFVRTGVRVRYEDLYFARRRRLNDLALAEAVEGEGRFIAALIDGILLICEESGWQLPAHNAQERGGTREPLPDPDRPVIDLFAAETAAQLAVLASLLGDRLDQACPGITRRIDREIAVRVTTPYLNRHFWWMGEGDAPVNNWTAWCTQNVLVSTFVRPTGQKLRRAVIEKAAPSLDAFLKDYGEDGACVEGVLYYRHAALCLFGALTVMEAAAPGAFARLWCLPKLRNMAEFVLHAHVSGRHYLNFADCSAVLEPCGAREFLFGAAVGSDALAALAASDARHDPRPERPDEINLWYRLLALSTAEKMAAFGHHATQSRDIYYPSAGLFIARDERFTVAAKAGHNGEDHGHNDVGSVIVYKDGRPLLIDVGVETYTEQTFSAHRHDLWTVRSSFHNLPTFDGVEQQAGARFAARDTRVDLDGRSPSIAMEIASAYPAAARVRSYRRQVELRKGAGVEIVDVHDGEAPAELSLMTVERPDPVSGGLRLGDLGHISLAGAGVPQVDEIPISDPRLRIAWPERIYRVLVPVAGPRLRLRIT